MEALLYEKRSDRRVECALCCHRCLIPAGKRGICGVRENRDGTLHTLVYGRLIAGHIDPIEKKPLFHFMPGSLSYSIATVGCNFRCRFCQNADIAQMPADRGGRILGEATDARAVVAAAARGGCRSIAYTYTEPTVFFEFALETARLAHAQGIHNVFVTNGYMTREALETIAPVLDAANVDLKAFNRSYYTEVCGAKLEHVQETLRGMKSLGVFVEVTTLIVPGLNDDPAELKSLAEFLVRDLGPDTPWHISRFHPTYRLTDRPPTPVETLSAARRIGRKAGLAHVYTGNVPGDEGENTFCPACGEALIERWGFRVANVRLEEGRCVKCGTPITGVWT
ncbi:MAG: AmmeMemoRadiSam system radical SAM enzyme [Desulfobacterales bacterium]|jgi:pyruvate formate lyase activating enzyme|nr:AmmeMemoRadiSam system radical SAM enzyme [Desulfobacterales bacterium]